MTYKLGTMFYEGKAKKLYEVDGHPELIALEYKNSLTAFNAQKKGEFSGKGTINQEISKIIFDHLEKADIKNHLVEIIDDKTSIVKKLSIIPLEVVVRNRIAGSLAKKFQLKEGASLQFPLVEFYYKKDELGDPFITSEQAVAMSLVPADTPFERIKTLALQVNQSLSEIFKNIGIELIDFKLEFGQSSDGEILLADEISPDSCRLWDIKTAEKLDKDRFRHDLGKVEESYQEVLKRLKEAKES